MPQNFRGRSIIRLFDLTSDDIRHLLRLAASLKLAKAGGYEYPVLERKNIALIFDEDCTRIRGGFDVAAHDQGACVTCFGPDGHHIGRLETVKDTARILGRIYDGIEYRGFDLADAEQLAKFSGVPVFSGLTAEFHPTQVLADMLTMREHSSKNLSDVEVCFIGDCGNKTGVSLMIGCALMGMGIRLCGPRRCWPDAELIARCRNIAEGSGARIMLSESHAEGLGGADFVYTDAWASLCESEAVWEDRIARLLPYRVNAGVMRLTGNPKAKFMHCLPAFHNTHSEIGEATLLAHGIDCMEVTEEVFESQASIVFDQAENRMHTIKAILVATMGP